MGGNDIGGKPRPDNTMVGASLINLSKMINQLTTSCEKRFFLKLKPQAVTVFLLTALSATVSPNLAMAESKPACVSMEDLISGQVSPIEGTVPTPCSDDAASQIGLAFGGRYGAFSMVIGPRFGPPNTRYFELSRHAFFLAEEHKAYQRSQAIFDMAYLELMVDKNETDPLKPLIWFWFLNHNLQYFEEGPSKEDLTFADQAKDQVQLEHVSRLRFEEILISMGGANLSGADIRCLVRHDIPRHTIKEIIETVAYKVCVTGGENE